MQTTGKTVFMMYEGRRVRLCNQRCRDWTARYDYQGSGETLSNAGCGIFSIANALSFMHGLEIDVDALADFSIKNGGRGDDGTDRPVLLGAMEKAGLALKYGFSYHGDGLRNDLDALFAHLQNGGAALCNLRVGHIVALVQARSVNGERQVLAADPYSESDDPRVTDNIRECIEGSEITMRTLNAQGVATGMQTHYALFWVTLATVRDFNLLYRLPVT